MRVVTLQDRLADGSNGWCYDFEQEESWWRQGDTLYKTGTAGSFIMACPICGEEHFRHEPNDFERCFDDGDHGPMVPLTQTNLTAFICLWAMKGDKITTVESRRAWRRRERSHWEEPTAPPPTTPAGG
jgi:hypothetical protein